MTAAQHLHTAVSLAGLGLALVGRGLALTSGPMQALVPFLLIGAAGLGLLGLAWAWKRLFP